jgi:CBS domain containing-hemolysin-like protein
VVFAIDVLADTHWYWTALKLMSVPALVALNGFFVASEFSLVALRGTKIEEMVQRGVRSAGAVAAATANLDRTIAATQLGITIASIALGWVGETALADLIEPAFAQLPAAWQGPLTHTLSTTLDFILITFMHVVFGELIPKSVALQASEETSLWIAKPLIVFIRLARPIIWVMNGFSNWVLRLFGFRPASSEDSAHSIEELRLLIEDTEEAGILDEDQAEFVQNVFQLSNKRVREVMVPREKIAALDVNTPPDKVLEAVRHGAHTRMPVYDGALDKIVGIVNTKDLFYLFSTSGLVVLEDAIYPATFLPPDEDVGSALRLLQRSRRPMALVRDDNDKIVGMITLEDVLEEIIGDIEDEHDRPMRKVRFRRRVGPRPAVVSGNGPIRPSPAAAPAADRRAAGPPSPSPPPPGPASRGSGTG